MALQIGAHLWIERVASEDNISDLRSREEYELLRNGFDAIWRKPVIDQLFVDMYLRFVSRLSVKPVWLTILWFCGGGLFGFCVLCMYLVQAGCPA